MNKSSRLEEIFLFLGNEKARIILPFKRIFPLTNLSNHQSWKKNAFTKKKKEKRRKIIFVKSRKNFGILLAFHRQSIPLSKMPSDRRICARFYPRNDACREKNLFHLLPLLLFFPPLPPPGFIIFPLPLSFLFFRQEEEEKEEEEGKNRQTHFVAGSFVAETESRPDRRANEASIVLSVF